MYFTNQTFVKLYLTFVLCIFLLFLLLIICNDFILLSVIFLKSVVSLNVFNLLLKKKLNILSEKRNKNIFSKNSVLLKKFVLLKEFTHVLFQYMCVPRRFNIGKLD